MKSISDCFLTKGTGKLFYAFSNADGKQWLMPAQNMRVAMNLYQPSGRNGKMVKRLFPWLHWLPLVRKMVHTTSSKYGLNENMNKLLGQVFHESELEFAIFFGTPCVHQKITMQVSKGSRILGYCKVTDSKEIASLFRQEERILNQLEERQMEGLPRCLYCGQTETGCYLFIQSTTKTQKSKVVHEWTALHDAFLHQMERNTCQTVLFEQSDYYRTLHDLRQHIVWLPKYADGGFIENVVEKTIAKGKGKEVEYSAYHADFTPWNMFVESGKLFVFDWEYSRLTYPPQLDRYHFFTQTAIFEKRWQAKEIIEYLQSPYAEWADKEVYTLYLLDIISRFTLREKGNIDENMEESFIIWFEILEYLQK